MWSDLTQYFSSEFKSRIIDRIKELRPVFEQEMHNVAFISFGLRFTDDEQVFQAFVLQCRCSCKDIKGHGKSWVQKLESMFIFDPNLFKHYIWQSLKDAAETDYHYENEKKY